MSPVPRLLHEFLRRTARRFPDAVAIEVPPDGSPSPRQLITYRQLDEQSDRLAAALAPLVTGECIVTILAGRDSHHLFAAQLGVLKAGAAFACLDPAFPDEQIREVLADSGSVAVLADEAASARLGRLCLATPPVIRISEALAPSRAPAAPPAPGWLTPQTLAYVIYTSGTTGRPKGVMIEHASIANLVASDVEAFALGVGDRVGQTSSAAYDSSIEETWLALAAGATLVVMDDHTSRLGPDLTAWLARERVTVLCPTPTLLRAMGSNDPERALPDLRLLYVGGEALPADVASRWAPGRQLVNGYGPTEGTVTTIRERVMDGDSIGIGRPVAGTTAWILDDHGEEISDGHPGELHLGGAGLARGYWNQPALTAKRFPVHPRLGRLFRTGDLAHRAADGRIFYHGRLDSLVKLRGYRVELEAIEARLAECSGVRQAACGVQGDGLRQMLVAFVVPDDPARAPSMDDLRGSLARVLPAYMVPSEIGLLDTLPVTVGGKLDRSRLPLAGAAQPSGGDVAAAARPRNALETKLTRAVRDVLGLPGPPSIHDDFFDVLGGDSLGVGLLVSELRLDPDTASIATRDVYDARTIANLAQRVVPASPVEPTVDSVPRVSAGQVIVTTLLQGLWLVGEATAGAGLAYLLVFQVPPRLIHAWGLEPVLLFAPLLLIVARAAWMPLALALAVIVKRLLIGRYTAAREPAWGGLFLRNWIVQNVAGLVPWDFIAGTEVQNAALRALGARIGRRVHIHRGVDVRRGGWDLLEIGDDVSIARDAAIRLVDLERGQLVMGPIVIGDGATLDVRAGMGPHSVLGAGASLTPLSSLSGGSLVPAGERWDGIPASFAGRTPPVPALTETRRPLSPAACAALSALAKVALWSVWSLPAGALAVGLARALGLSAEPSAADLVGAVGTLRGLLLVLAATSAVVPITVVLAGVASRALGRVDEGVVSRWSWSSIRASLKVSLLETTGFSLAGTIFWPVWLRWAGMRIGGDGEISTIIDTVPELVEIGDQCFLADGIYLGGPRLDRGTVTLGRVRLGSRTFIGNHVVVPGGTRLPDDVLLGVCTVADPRLIGPGSGWFGHPPMALPHHRPVAADRRTTFDPSAIRYLNRFFWEALRFVLPATLLIVALGWMAGVSAARATGPAAWLFLVAIPGYTLAAAGALLAIVVAIKWLLLGRAAPGRHGFWSCWCSRWDLVYVAWEMYGRWLLTPLEGTLWLSWYLRLMGMTIGRWVLLGPGFAQVVDPDMLTIEDEATVNAMFQAHTFEDRVLKIDRVRVGRGATLSAGTVPLYGADIGAGAFVAPHSIVMKGEHLAPDTRYAGAPARPCASVSASTAP